MRPRPSGPTQSAGRGMAISSQETSASPATAGRDEVTRQLDLLKKSEGLP